MTPSDEVPGALRRTYPVEGGGTGDQILRLYDQGIAGCLRRNAREVNAALVELIAALNFEYETAALVFFRLYDHCRRHVRAREFEVPLRILRELHEASGGGVAEAPRDHA